MANPYPFEDLTSSKISLPVKEYDWTEAERQQVSELPDSLQAGYLPSSARLVLILINRTAGSSPRKQIADETTKALEALGYVVKQIGDLAELKNLVEKTPQELLRCVITVGGDGTFGAAINNTPIGTSLTILPAGTENLMAGYLSLNRCATDLARLVNQGLTVRLDAGVANGQLFSLLASAGFDADVVHRLHAMRVASGSGNIRHLSYARPIIEAVRRYRYDKVRITGIDTAGEAIEPIEGSWFFGVNLPRYASGLRIAPGASGVDGLLDLCVLKRGQLKAAFWFLLHILRNRHHKLPSVATARVRSCLIESAKGHEIPYQVDGDPGGILPLELSVLPKRLRVLVTPSVAQGLVSTDS